MARGNEIVLSVEPKGTFIECTVVGTPKPGTVMELKTGVAEVGGRFSFEPAGFTAAVGVTQGMAADGNRTPIAVLDIDKLQGKTKDDAYVTGTRGFLYYPVAGEYLNMILENITGTAADQDFIIGTKLIVDDGTGKLLISAGTPESEPFICLEAVTDLAADYLCFVQYTGY